MHINLTIGEMVCEGAGRREVEIDLNPAAGSEKPTLGELADRFSIKLVGPEGALLVFVNSKIVSVDGIDKFKLNEGDAVSILRMLAGG